MMDLFKLILGVLASLLRSRAKLEAEILILRQQINVLRRRAPKRPHLNNTDRFLFVWLYHWFPCVLGAVAIVRPETIIRWNRAGFRAYWRWRSRNHVGRPKISAELRTLISEMSRANPLWGAPHIHGELLKLGFEVAQSTVARYMCRRHSRPPSQGWRTFLSNPSTILRAYARYYNDIRTHRSLDKDAPVSRPVQRTGIISSHAVLGGLHHHYARSRFSVHTGL